jgi:hypothetical protein
MPLPDDPSKLISVMLSLSLMKHTIWLVYVWWLTSRTLDLINLHRKVAAEKRHHLSSQRRICGNVSWNWSCAKNMPIRWISTEKRNRWLIVSFLVSKISFDGKITRSEIHKKTERIDKFREVIENIELFSTGNITKPGMFMYELFGMVDIDSRTITYFQQGIDLAVESLATLGMLCILPIAWMTKRSHSHFRK